MNKSNRSAERPDPRALGQVAERYAVEHLRKLGYRILATNVRYKVGEIDVVAEQGATLVFVEVRARRSGAYGTAAETVGAKKQLRVWRAAETYLQEQNVDPSRPCRIDVVAIQLDRAGRPAELEVIEDAFSGQE
jgi:putative endonuclease